MVACWASSGRSQRFVRPLSSTAEKASVLPSGETTTGPASKPEARKVVCGGGGMYARIESAGVLARCERKKVMSAASNKTAEISGSRYWRGFRDAGVGASAEEDAGDCQIAFNCRRTSWADWKRSSRSFARQEATRKSKAGGIRGLVAVMGSGSFSRMAEATLIWLLPSKARLPMAIS